MSKSIAIAVYTDNLRIEWHGGEYADVYNRRHIEAHDIINLWDYEKGAPRIEFTPDAFADAVDEWLLASVEGEEVRYVFDPQ